MCDYRCELRVITKEVSYHEVMRRWLSLCYKYETVNAYCQQQEFEIEKLHTIFGPEYYVQDKKVELLEAMHYMEMSVLANMVFNVKSYIRRTQ